MAVKKFSEANLTIAELDAWFDAAVADGWVASEIYPDHEKIDTAAYLEKDGYRVMLIRRKMFGSTPQPFGEISIWGPDGLYIPPPPTYDIEKLKSGLLFCQNCGYQTQKTSRVNFAGRCCSKCKADPKVMEKFEPSGWTN